MKKILFPFQVGKENKEAFTYAVKAARNMNAELIMLNAFDIPVDDSITKEKYKHLLKENWMKAYASIAKFHHYYLENYARTEGDMRIKSDYRFVHGKTSDEIFKIIKDEMIDLLIISLPVQDICKMKLAEILNHKVLKQTITSVLLIPQECRFKPIRKLVYATDFHKLKTGKYLLNQALKFARSYDATIHFLHFTIGKEDTIQDKESYELISELVQKEKNNLFKVITGKGVYPSLENYISDNTIDCIAIIKQQRGIFENLFHHSFTESISVWSKIPILVLIDKEL